MNQVKQLEKEKYKKKLARWKIAYLLEDKNGEPPCSVVSLDEFLKFLKNRIP